MTRYWRPRASSRISTPDPQQIGSATQPEQTTSTMSSYSPHRSEGGTLHLPSPTHLHHDPTSALSQLRRSLSRSPSKCPTFRVMASNSTSPSPNSPLSPSPMSPQNRTLAASLHSGAPPSPLGVSFPSSTRKPVARPRRVSPKGAPSRSVSASRTPARRPLGDSTNCGNGTPPSSGDTYGGPENFYTRENSPENTVNVGGANKFSEATSAENFLAPHHAFSRRERNVAHFNDLPPKSSPLKRNDQAMNFDQSSMENPSAKRRSLHGAASFGADFNIYDYADAMVDTPTDTGESNATGAPAYYEPQNIFTPLPRRTSSLRKTTLQQRHEKPTLFKSKPSSDLALEYNTSTQSSMKARSRLSMDSALPMPARESPFSSQGSLPSASLHPISCQRKEISVLTNQSTDQPFSQRHPLSRTLTQSSSGSSIAEDSPTHPPIRNPEIRRRSVDFSKSLPLGTLRPHVREVSATGSASTESSFATPENYKLAKPLQGVFMSTGLISKKNKDLIKDKDFDPNESVGHMPDTPCKKPLSLNAIAPIPSPDHAKSQAKLGHRPCHSFGTPSTPGNPHSTRIALGALGRGVSIFGSGYGNGRLTRRASFLGIEGEENSQATGVVPDSQSSAEFEIPPTPTKQVLGTSLAQTSKDIGHTVSSHVQDDHDDNYNLAIRATPPQTEQCCKFLPIHSPGGSVDGDGDSVMEESPSATLRFRNLNAISSFSKRSSFLNQHGRSPTPMPRKSLTLPLIRKKNTTKPSPLSPASPIFSRLEQKSPRTPQESMLPPDPSGLSISAHGDGAVHQSTNAFSNSVNSSFLPATPTASRDSFPRFGKGRSSITPIHHIAPPEVDHSLTSRFEKVEAIGTGEFSQVFKVTSKQAVTLQSCFLHSAVRASPKTPLRKQLWAVKKSLHPYIGPRDRKHKLQEVEILRALGHSDHTVQYFDSWENMDHLYIQLEYCEEGSMDKFLEQTGRKARLDDFRIWKILLELSQGLKHVHDSGFIHLDLKPANILINFEGVLKIADFGMASVWPAPAGIDGEGDREYIGPEILEGFYDKPADIFALGLIMLEIAANVMLPENGQSWQRLRSGDMSDVPSLTWDSDATNISRDSSGKPLMQSESFEDLYGPDCAIDDIGSPDFNYNDTKSRFSRFQRQRAGELIDPPAFMTDARHEESMDKIVRWMIDPEPVQRPVVDQVISAFGVQWAESRRRAGATIFEGNWGPTDEMLHNDLEMIDV